MMTCGHTPTVRLSWVTECMERTELDACNDCAQTIWDRLAYPLQETFTVQELETK